MCVCMGRGGGMILCCKGLTQQACVIVIHDPNPAHSKGLALDQPQEGTWEPLECAA